MNVFFSTNELYSFTKISVIRATLMMAQSVKRFLESVRATVFIPGIHVKSWVWWYTNMEFQHLESRDRKVIEEDIGLEPLPSTCLCVRVTHIHVYTYTQTHSMSKCT